MEFRIQPLSRENSNSLCKLFAEEEHLRSSILWQDRSPDFFALYSHMTSEGPLAFGLTTGSAGDIENDKLIGSSLLVPVGDSPIRFGVGQEWNLVYDTDCFVDPNYRSRGVSSSLIGLRNQTLQKSAALYLGIENQPGFLRSIAEDPGSYLADFVYGPTTVLHDIYPSEERAVSSSSVFRLEKIPLASVAPALLVRLEKLNEDKKAVTRYLFPSSLEKGLPKISKVDPNAEIWVALKANQIVAALTVANFQSVRRFRYNSQAVALGLSAHPLNKLGLNPNEVLKSLIVGQSWCGAGDLPALAFLLKAVGRKIREDNFHNFYFRDAEPMWMDGIFPNVYHYPRKLIFWMFQPEQKGRQLLREIQQKRWQFKLDNHYL